MMKIEPIEANGILYLSCKASEPPIGTEDDAVELLSACFSHRSELLMLHADALADAFFDLKTRAAGLIVQKLVNYRIRTAIVVPPAYRLSERMREWFAESGKGSEFRVFDDAAAAEAWLLAQGAS